MSQPDQYIANMRAGAVAGFKYFDMGEATQITVKTTGSGVGKLVVSEKKNFSVINAELTIQAGVQETTAPLTIEAGVKPLYFRFEGTGAMDFHSFALEK
jgi:hypothetical protein